MSKKTKINWPDTWSGTVTHVKDGNNSTVKLDKPVALDSSRASESTARTRCQKPDDHGQALA